MHQYQVEINPVPKSKSCCYIGVAVNGLFNAVTCPHLHPKHTWIWKVRGLKPSHGAFVNNGQVVAKTDTTDVKSLATVKINREKGFIKFYLREEGEEEDTYIGMINAGVECLRHGDLTPIASLYEPDASIIFKTQEHPIPERSRTPNHNPNPNPKPNSNPNPNWRPSIPVPSTPKKPWVMKKLPPNSDVLRALHSLAKVHSPNPNPDPN